MITIHEPAVQHSNGPTGPSSLNGFATTALLLGVIATALCPFDPINALGFLAGLIGIGLAIPGLVVAARRNTRVGAAVTALMLCLLGATVSPIIGISNTAPSPAAGTTTSGGTAPGYPSGYSSGYSSAASSPSYSYSAPTSAAPSYAPSYEAPAAADSAPAYTPPAPEVYTYKITGPGRASTITYSTTGGNTSQATSAKLPWTKKVQDPGVSGMPFAYVSAQNNGGGTITCQIVGPTGQVISENSSEGQYSIVSCQS